MKNTIKTLIFIASLFIFLGIFVGIGRLIIDLPSYYTTAAGLASFILALGVQGLLKHIYIIPRIKSHVVLMSFPVKTIMLKDRLTAAIIPFFAVFSSWFYARPASETIISSITVFVIFLILLEMLLKFGESTMQIYFTTIGVGVSGYDFRPEFTLPFTVNNLPGIYEYDRIVHFTSKEDTIVLAQYFDSNRLIVKASEEDLKKIVGLLIGKKILPEKYQGLN